MHFAFDFCTTYCVQVSLNFSPDLGFSAQMQFGCEIPGRKKCVESFFFCPVKLSYASRSICCVFIKLFAFIFLCFAFFNVVVVLFCWDGLCFALSGFFDSD